MKMSEIMELNQTRNAVITMSSEWDIHPSPYAPLARTQLFDIAEQVESVGNDSNLLIVFYVQIMPDDLVMQLHRF